MYSKSLITCIYQLKKREMDLKWQLHRHLKSKIFDDEPLLVIVTGFETHAGLRVGYAGYGYGLDFVDPWHTRTLGAGTGLPAV